MEEKKQLPPLECASFIPGRLINMHWISRALPPFRTNLCSVPPLMYVPPEAECKVISLQSSFLYIKMPFNSLFQLSL